MTMIFFIFDFFWFELEMRRESGFEKVSGKTTIGSQHLRVYPSAVGTGEE